MWWTATQEPLPICASASQTAATTAAATACRTPALKNVRTEISARSKKLRDMAAAAVRCGVRKIRVTGGEPLVRRGAVDFCRMLAEIPGVEELCATTNGSLLAEQAAALREAGVTRLNISLDTLKEERFRTITRLGALSDVLRGIEAAERAGFEKIKLNCVLLGGVNDDEIADFAALTRARRLAGALHRAHADGLRQALGTYLPAQAVLERCPELEVISHDGVAACYRFPARREQSG